MDDGLFGFNCICPPALDGPFLLRRMFLLRRKRGWLRFRQLQSNVVLGIKSSILLRCWSWAVRRDRLLGDILPRPSPLLRGSLLPRHTC